MTPVARIEELVGRAAGTHYRWRCCVGLEPCASGPWLDEAGARLGKAEHEQLHADEERREAALELEYEEAIADREYQLDQALDAEEAA